MPGNKNEGELENDECCNCRLNFVGLKSRYNAVYEIHGPPKMKTVNRLSVYTVHISHLCFAIHVIGKHTTIL